MAKNSTGAPGSGYQCGMGQSSSMAQPHPTVSQQTLELCLHSQCQDRAGVPCLSPKALNGISILILFLHMLGCDRLFSQRTGTNPGQEKGNKSNLQIQSEDSKARLSYFTLLAREVACCVASSSLHLPSTSDFQQHVEQTP